jgi:hypothetical protein
MYKHTLKTPYLIKERNEKYMRGVAATSNEISKRLIHTCHVVPMP